jgi:hypothetical protein
LPDSRWAQPVPPSSWGWRSDRWRSDIAIIEGVILPLLIEGVCWRITSMTSYYTVCRWSICKITFTRIGIIRNNQEKQISLFRS